MVREMIKDEEIFLIEDMTNEELKAIKNSEKIKIGFNSEDELVKLNKRNKRGIVSTISVDTLDVLNLHNHMDRWAIYRAGVAPVSGNQFAYLRPAMFGGLSYICRPGIYADVKEIETNQYGYVQIYAPADSDSCMGYMYPGSTLCAAIVNNPEGRLHGKQVCDNYYNRH